MYEVFAKLLESHHIDAAALCRKLEIPQSTVSNWKKRNNLISADLALKIAAYFGITLDYLYTGKESTVYIETHLTEKEHEIITALRSLNEEAYYQVTSFIEFQLFEGNTKKSDQIAVV